MFFYCIVLFAYDLETIVFTELYVKVQLASLAYKDDYLYTWLYATYNEHTVININRGLTNYEYQVILLRITL